MQQQQSISSKQLKQSLQPIDKLSPRNSPYIRVKNGHHLSRKRGPTVTEYVSSPTAVQQMQLKRMSTKDIQSEAEQLQQGNLKLIFLPKHELPSENIGFKTFTEMMKTNTSWVNKVPQLSSYREYETEQTTFSREFPTYLQNRLKFNKTQTQSFQRAMDQKQDMLMTQGLIPKRLIRAPQVKLRINDTKNNDDSQDEKEKDLNKQMDKLDQDAKNVKLRNLKLLWYSIQTQESWKPSTREGCSITNLEQSHRCLLYGGIGRDLFNSFVQLNTRTWTWQDLGPGTGECPQGGRFGHSATLYKKQIIFYGGEREYNPSLKMRECFSDVRMYNPQTTQWQYCRTFGDIAEARRNHCAALCGRFIFITGGVSSYGRYLNDLCALNLDTLKWSLYDLEGHYPDGIAFATGLSLFPAEIKIETPYLTYEYVRKKGRKFLKLGDEGIFIFGGRLGNGEATNELKVIKLGTKPLFMKRIDTKGIAPTPRYMHTMNYYEALNICVIYGGRDDSNETRGRNIKNDMFIIDMENFNWIQVSFIGQPEYGKCSHCSVFLESKLIIFGGYSSDNFQNSDILIVEFDQQKTRLMLKEIKTRQKNYNNQPIVLSLTDIQNDPQLKMFTMDNFQSVDQIIQNETKNKDVKGRVTVHPYTNLKTFQPLPIADQSHLIKEFKLKKELERNSEPKPYVNQGTTSNRLSLRPEEDFSYKMVNLNIEQAKQIVEEDSDLE